MKDIDSNVYFVENKKEYMEVARCYIKYLRHDRSPQFIQEYDIEEPDFYPSIVRISTGEPSEEIVACRCYTIDGYISHLQDIITDLLTIKKVLK